MVHSIDPAGEEIGGNFYEPFPLLLLSELCGFLALSLFFLAQFVSRLALRTAILELARAVGKVADAVSKVSALSGQPAVRAV